MISLIQATAILSLLMAFGVDQPTLDTVRGILIPTQATSTPAETPLGGTNFIPQTQPIMPTVTVTENTAWTKIRRDTMGKDNLFKMVHILVTDSSGKPIVDGSQSVTLTVDGSPQEEDNGVHSLNTLGGINVGVQFPTDTSTLVVSFNGQDTATDFADIN